MAKWRPTDTWPCVYAISSIRGAIGPLKIICNRILPLRKNEGILDKLVLLGDYIGDGKSSFEVLDFLCSIKKKNKDRLIILKGEAERDLIKAIELKDIKYYDYFIAHGGKKLVTEYMKNAKVGNNNPYNFPRERFKDIVPQSHKNLLYNMESSYAIDNYLFNSQNIESDKINIIGTNSLTKPYFNHKGREISLEIGAPQKVLVVELHSMQAFVAKHRKKKLVKYMLEEL